MTKHKNKKPPLSKRAAHKLFKTLGMSSGPLVPGDQKSLAEILRDKSVSQDEKILELDITLESFYENFVPGYRHTELEECVKELDLIIALKNCKRTQLLFLRHLDPKKAYGKSKNLVESKITELGFTDLLRWQQDTDQYHDIKEYFKYMKSNTGYTADKLLKEALRKNYKSSAYQIIAYTTAICGSCESVNNALLTILSEQATFETFSYIIDQGGDKMQLNHDAVVKAIERDMSCYGLNNESSYLYKLLSGVKTDNFNHLYDNDQKHIIISLGLLNENITANLKFIIETIITHDNPKRDNLRYYLEILGAETNAKDSRKKLLTSVDPQKRYGRSAQPALYHAVTYNLTDTVENLLPKSNRSTKWITYFLSHKITLAIWITLLVLSYQFIRMVPFIDLFVHPLAIVASCLITATVGTISIYGLGYFIKENFFHFGENSFSKLHKSTWGSAEPTISKETTNTSAVTTSGIAPEEIRHDSSKHEIQPERARDPKSAGKKSGL